MIQNKIILVDKQLVNVNLFTPKTDARNQAVLFLHGWTGKPNTHAAQLLSNNGFYAMTLIFRGHPGSDGDIKTITAQDSLNDALEAYDFFTSKIPAGMPIAVVGSSYGSYIAALLSAKVPCNGLSLRVPANYPDDLFDLPKWGRGNEDSAVAAWRLVEHGPHDNSALKAINSFNYPVQIFQAEFDDAVPEQTVKNYANSVAAFKNLEYNFMKDWPHSLADHKERNKEFQKLLLIWLEGL